MKIQSFEEIVARQIGRQLTKRISLLLKKCNDYSLKDQIHRASVSITNNIAEWFERQSNKELRQFLYIAKWSSAEVRSMLYNAIDLNYITQNEFHECYNQALRIARLLSGFIKTL